MLQVITNKGNNGDIVASEVLTHLLNNLFTWQAIQSFRGDNPVEKGFLGFLLLGFLLLGFLLLGFLLLEDDLVLLIILAAENW